jgi:putative CocE/NonD family hydrolase
MGRLHAVIAVLALVASAALDVASYASAAPAHSNYPKTYTIQRFLRMSDGVELGATISFPSTSGSAPAPGRFPVVLDMTPYGRDGACACDSATVLTAAGFVLAVVDVRGTGGSGGNLDANYFSPRSARDGYEVVQWLGSQPWSNGKVGMSGGSYLGIMQYLVAELDPSHLAAIAPDEALADIYNDAAYPGGILSMSFDTQYLGVQGGPGLLTPNTSAQMAQGTITAKQQQATGRSIAFDYLAHTTDDGFYRARSPITEVSRIHVPVYVFDGWRDAFEAGDLRMFQALEDRKAPTFVHIDACTHKGCGGEFAPTDNPPDPDNVEALEIRFFDRYLLGESVPPPPPVRVYVQQLDRYVDATAWPPPSTRFVTQSLGVGTITSTAGQTSVERYVADPSAGLSMSLDEQGTVAASPYLPLDQRLEDNQGLTWRTPVLSQPTTLDGPIALHLVAASSATDTDWFAKVSDVMPSGAESIVAEGQLRASMRALARGSTNTEPLETLTSPQPVPPGKFLTYQIAIAPTAYRFAKGDRLQIRLTSYNMPNALPAKVRFDRDDPAATQIAPLLPATNSVRVGRGGTTLTLPLAPS